MTNAGKFSSLFALFPPTAAQVTTLPVELQKHSGLRPPDGLGGKFSIWKINLSADYTLPNEGKISALASRGVTNNWDVQDAFFGAGGSYGAYMYGFIRWTQDTYFETRYTSSANNRLRYMLGFSYYKLDLDASGLQSRKVLDMEKGENYGVFGSIDFDITKQLTLSLEGRWNKDTQTIIFNGPTEIQPTETPFAENKEQSFERFMPRVILKYQATPDLNIYASWSQSAIQGVATNAAAYAAAVPDAGINPDTVGYFTPVQTLSSYEIGIKHQAAPWLYYSIAGYYFDWKNQVVADLSPNFTAIYLPGSSRILGIDFEADLRPTDWLTINASANWNDDKLKNFGAFGSLANAVLAPGLIVGGIQIDASGNRMRWNPEWSGSIGTELNLGKIFNYQPGAFIRLDSIYTGKFYTDNFDFNYVPGTWRFNARFGVNVTEDISVEVYGNNITNNLNWTTVASSDTSDGANRKTFGVMPRKREIGVRLIAKF